LKFKIRKKNKNFSSRRDLRLFLSLAIKQFIKSAKMWLKKHLIYPKLQKLWKKVIN